MTKRGAVNHAKKVVYDYGLAEKLPIDVAWLAKELGIAVVEESLPDESSGFLLRRGGLAICAINKRQSLTRRRFTIAHEIGHFLLHPPVPEYDGLQVNRRDAEASAGNSRLEIQANAFAAELLMPEDLIRERFRRPVDLFEALDRDRVTEAARQFGVSEQAMTYRLTSLDLLVD